MQTDDNLDVSSKGVKEIEQSEEKAIHEASDNAATSKADTSAEVFFL